MRKVKYILSTISYILLFFFITIIVINLFHERIISKASFIILEVSLFLTLSLLLTKESINFYYNDGFKNSKVRKKCREESEEFVGSVNAIKEYWLSLNKTKEETARGICFSILVLLDGDSAINNFKQISLSTNELKEFNKELYLHEIPLEPETTEETREQ